MKKYFFSLFLSALFSLFSFVISSNLGLGLFPNALIQVVLLIACLAAVMVILGKQQIIYFSLFTAILFSVTYLLTAFYIVDLHIAIFSLAMFFLFQKDLTTTLNKIALPGDIKKNAMYGFLGFLLLIVAGAIAILILNLLFNVSDEANVFGKISELPQYVILFAIIAAPFSEEIFFRAFLTERFGIIVSSILFAVSHVAYGSIVELVGAFVLGLMLALIFKRTKSVTPGIIAHLLYNLLALVSTGLIAR